MFVSLTEVFKQQDIYLGWKLDKATNDAKMFIRKVFH